MSAGLCVILYGNSVFLAGIQAVLNSRGYLNVVTIQAGQRDAAAQIRARRPIAVIFDMAAAQPDFAISLLHDRPGLLLIGVDPSSDELLVLSGQQTHAVTTTDLAQLIEAWPGSVPSRQRLFPFARLSQLMSSGAVAVRAHPRKQKLFLALAALAVCVILVLALSLVNPTANVPLTGAAVGGAVPDEWWAFLGGILLGSLLVGVAVSYGRRVWRKTR